MNTPPISTVETSRSSVRLTESLTSIDVVRGIAILMVILVHSKTTMVGNECPKWLGATAEKGRYGVQLFFIASALTLMLSALGRSRARDAAFWRGFFVRRFFRIAPLYWLAAVMSPLFYYAVQQRAIPWLGIPINMAFLHGLVPAYNNNVVPGGWSIGTEMLFYALFPMVLAACSTRMASAIFLAASFVISFASLQLWSVLNIPYAVDHFGYFNILTQLPVFAMGCFLFWVRDWFPPGSKRLWMLFLGIVLLALGGRLAVPLGWEHIPAAIAMWLVAGGLLSFEGSLKSLNVVQQIGKLSFSMYVVHFAVLTVLSHAPIHVPELRVAFGFVFGTAITYFLATLTYKWVEAPALDFGRRIAKRLESQSA